MTLLALIQSLVLVFLFKVNFHGLGPDCLINVNRFLFPLNPEEVFRFFPPFFLFFLFYFCFKNGKTVFNLSQTYNRKVELQQK